MTDPLAAVSVLSLLEDREGNLWVGTETEGLHVLRDQRFLNIGAREGLSSRRNDGGDGGRIRQAVGRHEWRGAQRAAAERRRPGEAPSYALPDVLLSPRDPVAGGRQERLAVGRHKMPD